MPHAFSAAVRACFTLVPNSTALLISSTVGSRISRVTVAVHTAKIIIYICEIKIIFLCGMILNKHETKTKLILAFGS